MRGCARLPQAAVRCVLAFLLVALFASPLLAGKEDSRQLAVDGINAFAFDLYQHLSEGDDNVFFSPYSISSAMTLAILGASGETKIEMRDALRYPEYDNQLHGGMKRLIETLNARTAKSEHLELHTASALWADGSVEIQQRYSAHLKRFYGTEPRRVDFRINPEAAREKVNQWVQEQTNGRIEDLLAEGVVTEATRIVIANALYFRCPWLHLFVESDTKMADFILADGSTVETPLMYQREQFGYFETDQYQAIEIPYRERKLAMVVLLPRPGIAVTTLEDSLAETDISSLNRRLEPTGVDLYLPRFHTERSYSLEDALRDMGVAEAFAGTAEFPGFGGSLWIDRVIHRTFVSIDEEGTEAAGATALIFEGAMAVENLVVFRADRPFVFMIRDAGTGVILFMGRVMNPQS